MMQRYYFLLENMYRAMIIFRLTCLVGYPRTSAPEPVFRHGFIRIRPVRCTSKFARKDLPTRPERAEAPSPGQRPGLDNNQQSRPVRAKALKYRTRT